MFYHFSHILIIVLNNESIKIIDFETYIGTYECKSNIFMLKQIYLIKMINF